MTLLLFWHHLLLIQPMVPTAFKHDATAQCCRTCTKLITGPSSEGPSAAATDSSAAATGRPTM